jgi:hypothetical protein
MSPSAAASGWVDIALPGRREKIWSRFRPPRSRRRQRRRGCSSAGSSSLMASTPPCAPPCKKPSVAKNQASKATDTQLRSKNVKVTKGSKPSWVRCLSTLRQSMRNLDKIFGRYNRGSNVSGIVGTGVALYLVEIVAGLDHGSVTVESVDARGLLHRAPAAAARRRWRFRVRVQRRVCS